MDKNTIYGFVLIALIIIGFSQLTKKSDKEIAAEKRYNDSIALVEQAKVKSIPTESTAKEAVLADSTVKTDTASVVNTYGDFSASAKGEEKYFILENKLVKLTISSKGGRICDAQLKNYRTHDSLPLILFNEQESSMGFTLVTNNNRVLNTTDLYFEPVSTITKDSVGNQTLIMRLKTSGTAYMDFAYTLPADNYMLGFGIKAYGMNTVMPLGINSLEMQWSAKIRQQEKGRKFEERYSSLEYKYVADDVEKLSESKSDEKKLDNKVKWVAFKDQFFSSILISDDAFTSTTLKSVFENDSSKYLKSFNADMTVAFDPSGKQPTNFQIYFGPNQYKILSAYDKGVKSDLKLSLIHI